MVNKHILWYKAVILMNGMAHPLVQLIWTHPLVLQVISYLLLLALLSMDCSPHVSPLSNIPVSQPGTSYQQEDRVGNEMLNFCLRLVTTMSSQFDH